MALFNHITSWFYSKNGALAVCLIKKEGIYQWVSPKFRYHGNPHGFETTLCPLKKNIKWSTGCWCNNHLEKYESQWEGLSHILWKIKNDPNHQLAKHHITISSLNRFSADQFALVFFIRVAPLQMVLPGHGRYNGIQRKCSNGPWFPLKSHAAKEFPAELRTCGFRGLFFVTHGPYLGEPVPLK